VQYGSGASEVVRVSREETLAGVASFSIDLCLREFSNR
jgi:hypothetical protein